MGHEILTCWSPVASIDLESRRLCNRYAASSTAESNRDYESNIRSSMTVWAFHIGSGQRRIQLDVVRHACLFPVESCVIHQDQRHVLNHTGLSDISHHANLRYDGQQLILVHHVLVRPLLRIRLRFVLTVPACIIELSLWLDGSLAIDRRSADAPNQERV
jgi:hypothetical protein